MGKETPPKTLYRYVSDIERVEEVVEKNVLSFAHPSTFNDPFDCKTLFDYESATKEEMKPFLTMVYRKSRPNFNQNIIEVVIEKTLEKWPDNIQILRDFESMVISDINKRAGVCCFSATKKDILMWSHYADKHKGYCLEFDVRVLSGEGKLELNRVSYRDDYPHVREFGEGGDDLALAKILVLSKSTHWEYEKEWRTFIRSTGLQGNHFPVEIPSTALVGIIFGCNCPDEQIEWVKTFVRESGKQVKLYKAEKSKNTYSVDIQEMGN